MEIRKVSKESYCIDADRHFSFLRFLKAFSRQVLKVHLSRNVEGASELAPQYGNSEMIEEEDIRVIVDEIGNHE